MTCTTSSVAVMLRKMQREVNTGRPFEKKLHIEYTTNNHAFQLGQQAISIVAAWQFFPEENNWDPELCGIFGATRVSV